MPEVTLKAGDTTPEFTATLKGAAQAFTGDETVRFYMEAPGDTAQTSGDLIVNAAIPGSQIDYADADAPTVTYDFGAGETSRVGAHVAEVVVTYADGEVQSFPSDDRYFVVQINEPVARDVPVSELDAPDITVGVVDASQVSAPALQAVETLTGAITGEKTLSNITGANLAIDANGTLNATDTDTDTQRTDEEVQDIVGALVGAAGAASVEYDDSAETLTISSTDTDTDTHLTDEEVQDIVGAFVTGGGATTVSYDDAGDALTISSTDTDTQRTDPEIATVAENALSDELAARLTAATDERVEHGTVGITPNNPPADSTWATSSLYQSSVTFDTAFSATPTVLCSLSGGLNYRGGIAGTRDVAVDGFTFEFSQYRGDRTSSSAWDGYWIAIGPK